MRPRKKRLIRSNPLSRFYKPQGVPMREMEVIPLKDEEWEAIKLADYKGLNHEEAAELMGVSRPTFSRLIASARKVVASALVEGAALEIGGGDFERVSEEKDNKSKEKKMKIAFSTIGNDLSASVEPKFGRSPKFIVFDTEHDSFVVIENIDCDASGGAGIKAAETVVKAGVSTVVTGDCGPKALNALKQSDVTIYSAKNMSIEDALEQCRAEKLAEIK